MQYDLAYKLIIIGNTSVGKSTLLMRYIDEVFNESFYPTIGVDFKIKTIQLDGQKIKLQIWDTAGQQKFKSILTNYYKGAHGIIVVFDITDRASFQNVKDWVYDAQRNGRQDAVKILIGNKCDLEHKREVYREEALRLAQSLGMKYIETSTKDGLNVQNAFIYLTSEMRTNIKQPTYKTTIKNPPVCLKERKKNTVRFFCC